MKGTKMEQHNSVVYSFNSRWEEALVSGEVKVFFRKRRPVAIPNRVFFYIGMPVKKIIGFADVTKIEMVDLESAKKIGKSAAITKDELTSYIGPDRAVHAVWITSPRIFSKPFGLSDLHERYAFNPPQSFSNVSAEFEKYLLGMA